MPTKEEFSERLKMELRAAELRGADHVDINSGDLHRRLGGYLGGLTKIPSCCNAIYEERKRKGTLVSGADRPKARV
jgi:5-methylcytosine-specific restriction protein A